MSKPDAAFDLLCAIARPRPDLKRASELLKQGVDLDVLFSLADRHAVRPALAPLPGLEPDPARAQALRAGFESFARPHALRTLTIVQNLLKVADVLAGAGIPFVVFKGPVLAQQLYDGLGQREYVDIDLLVPGDRVEAAKSLLAAMGYRNTQGDPDFVRYFLRSQRQVALDHPGAEAAIDLHWAFTGHTLPFPLAPGEAWSCLETVRLGDRDLPTLAAGDLALLLAGHGTKEGWHKLAWVSDFARLVERCPALDWADLLARARRRHCGNAVLLAAAMAHRLLQTPVPAALAGPLAASPTVNALAGRLAADLATGAGEEDGFAYAQDTLLCDRVIDRWFTKVRIAVMPGAGDFRALPLPRPLWGLYWLIRPVRLALRALRGPARRT